MFYAILTVFVAAIVGLAQWTKWLTVQHLPLHADGARVFGIFHITHEENTGAAWSMLEGQTWLFIVMAVVFVVLLGVMIWKKWITKKFEFICLAAILGGAIGNLIDRIATGRVVDMICLDFIRFPVFNVADCFITCGCLALVVYILFSGRSKKIDEAEG